MRPDTELVLKGEEYKVLGAVTPPIFQTSLFVQESVAKFALAKDPQDMGPDHFVYSRVGNPNLDVAEAKIASLEGTEACQIYASGMAAITAGIFGSLKAGDHVVAVDSIYGPTRIFFDQFLRRFGVETTFVPGHDTQQFLDAARPNTALMYLESPSSIVFRLQDLKAITSFAQERNITTMMDNTYSAGIFQQPHSMGVDLIAHSASKFFGGHSDLVAGALCGSKQRLDSILDKEAQFLGSLMPPFPAWLLMRGLRTVRLRVGQSQKTGQAMFDFLRQRSEVAEVFHAGDPDSPQAHLAQSQMSGSVSLMSFIPRCQDPGKLTQFIEGLKLFNLGVSWGGHESLVVAFPHQLMDWSEPKFIVRLYGGLEDPEDLLEDLDQALRHISV